MTFEDIYRKYSARVLNLIYRMTMREDVARDLTQDVFLKVYDSLPDFRHESEVYTWIHRIAVNHTLNFLKREKRFRPLVNPNEILGRVVQHSGGERDFRQEAGEEDVEAALEREERTKIVGTAVRSLPPKYRVPLILFHYEGLSYREIGEFMELSQSAVESRIHRAKKRLLEILGPMAGKI